MHVGTQFVLKNDNLEQKILFTIDFYASSHMSLKIRVDHFYLQVRRLIPIMHRVKEFRPEYYDKKRLTNSNSYTLNRQPIKFD